MKGNYAKEKTKTNSIIKKLIFVVIVITMLAGDFILPIKLWSIAKEYSEIAKNITASASETTNANSSEESSANDAENEANKANESNKTEEKSEDNAKESDASSVSEENANDKNLSNENSNDENSNTNLENNKTSSAIKRNAPVGLLNTNNSLALPQTKNNNVVQEEKTLEQLDSEMKATSKDTINERKQNNTYKTRNNLYEIRRFSTQFLSGAKKDGNGNLVWSATTNNSGHEFTFRVNYELSGYREIPEGCFRITIPKQILRNRNGYLADNYIMSLPTLAECKEEGKIAELIYKEDGDYLVIYNPKPVDSGLNGYFEISYATSSETYNYKDYNPENTNLVKNGGTASDEFYAILELNVNKDTENSEKEILNNITEDKNVFINTRVQLQSTQKRYPTIYRDWNTAWTEEVPDDKDDYYYLVWEISSYIGDVTQKYNFTLDDFVTNLTEGSLKKIMKLLDINFLEKDIIQIKM